MMRNISHITFDNILYGQIEHNISSMKFRYCNISYNYFDTNMLILFSFKYNQLGVQYFYDKFKK